MTADPSTQSHEEVARQTATDIERGLSAAEAARRLQSDGANLLRTAPRIPGWRRLLAHFQDPLVYLLLSAMGIALLAWTIDGRSGWPADAVVIGVIVLINAVLGFVQESRAEQAVAALARMSAIHSVVLRDGRQLRVPSADLVAGDMLVLGEGDAVGADARLLRASALRVQEAPLTGESQAVLKDAATLPVATALGDRVNMVFKGTSVAQGTGLAMVTATGMQTQMGAIAAMLEATNTAPTPLQREIARVGRMLGMAVVAIALVVVVTILLVTEITSARDVVDVLLLGVALAVAAVPEGLPAILSVVLALGLQRMAGHKAIVKDLASVETLGCASVICSDKTGTLTRSEMTIERVVTASGSVRVTGVGYEPLGHLDGETPGPAGEALRQEQIVLLSGGSLAGNAQLSQAAGGAWEIHGDPTEAAFLVAERKLGVHERRERRFERIGEIPFTSERKMMSSIEIDHEHAGVRMLVTKGAPDVLLARCNRARVGLAAVALTAALREKMLAEVDRMSDAALRTLAVAYRPLAPGEDLRAGPLLEHDLIFVGTVGMIDPPRPQAREAIVLAHRAGIRVLMITGDHPRTAARIAADLGIVSAGEAALTGQGIDAMDDGAFAAAVRKFSVFARVSPAHKLRIVDALQADGNVVAMTGDGVNDAPALKSADIGIAMGITGTEVTKEAARMILADDNFSTIVQAVREGRNIFDNIRKFLRYLLSSNMGEVLTVFLGVVGAGTIGLATPGGAVVLPLLATQILWLNLITDSWPALAMGLDPATGDAMARKPRRRDERVIDSRMWFGIVEIGLVVALASLLTLDLYLPGGLIEGSQDVATARTACFTTLVFAHLFNCFNARSETASAFHRMFSNPWLWGAVALSGALQLAVVHLPVLNLAFGTVALSLEQWLVCVAMGSAVLWFGELRKLIHRALVKPQLA
ncbi:MAG: cation-translocating P-type ATPase [Comamonadaceae bacterium]|nr:MAG: cation-translocating P-type ATPase [Comamonadaceae bacterium]